MLSIEYNHEIGGLIIKRERGKLYDVMIQKAEEEKMLGERNENIEVWFEQRYDLVYRRVLEFINFFKLSAIYPVILLSGVHYYKFARYYKKIVAAIENSKLKEELSTPVNIRYEENMPYDVELNDE